MALIGNALKIKPVIALVNGKAEPVLKVRGFQAGVRAMLDLLEKEGFDKNLPVYFGHTNNEERGKSLMEETKEKYSLTDCKLYPVGYVIGTHGGPDAVAFAYVKASS
jgi:fatty acid-binding protein DegV